MTALVYCPFPDEEEAVMIGRQLIEEEFVACVNIGSPVRSIFAWEGRIDESTEVPALLKTSSAKLEQAIKRLEDLHPYDTPAILGWHCAAAGAATEEWLGAL